MEECGMEAIPGGSEVWSERVCLYMRMGQFVREVIDSPEFARIARDTA
jgi:hypothetical protein